MINAIVFAFCVFIIFAAFAGMLCFLASRFNQNVK